MPEATSLIVFCEFLDVLVQLVQPWAEMSSCMRSSSSQQYLLGTGILFVGCAVLFKVNEVLFIRYYSRAVWLEKMAFQSV